uniref:Uncharacterized protein n=1 Tax=Sphaerodactylus townsendi TaxID=933632 RepID=A0ACB8E947_9SAUR
MEYNKKHEEVVISTLQVQVDDVKNVMSQNIEKVLDREERLTELADRSSDLETAVLLDLNIAVVMASEVKEQDKAQHSINLILSPE